jgi:hypothetical protein
MGTTSTLPTLEERTTPFTGGTDRDRLLRGAARGETVFFLNDIWDAAGAGQDRSINFICNLDKDYAWVLTDASCSFIRASSPQITLEATGLLEISIPSPGGTEYIYSQYNSWPSRQNSGGTTAIGSILAADYNTLFPVVTETGAMTFDLVQKPSYMLYPWKLGGDQVQVANIFSDAKQNEAAISYRFAARFLQYDISQVYDYRVQSPQLTR